MRERAEATSFFFLCRRPKNSIAVRSSLISNQKRRWPGWSLWGRWSLPVDRSEKSSGKSALRLPVALLLYGPIEGVALLRGERVIGFPLFGFPLFEGPDTPQKTRLPVVPSLHPRKTRFMMTFSFFSQQDNIRGTAYPRRSFSVFICT